MLAEEDKLNHVDVVVVAKTNNSIAENALQYFSWSNQISEVIIKETKQFILDFGEEKFSSLKLEEQENLLDNFFINDAKSFYKDHPELGNFPTMFPKLNACYDEKIVELPNGDFIKDEYAGDFSWETKSQSEFSMENMNDIEKPKVYRVPSPKFDRQKENKGKLWQSPFLANDRIKGVSTEGLQMFENFALKLDNSDDFCETDTDLDIVTTISSVIPKKETPESSPEKQSNIENQPLIHRNDSPTIKSVEFISVPIKDNDNVIEFQDTIIDEDYDVKEIEKLDISGSKTGFDFLDNW